VKKILGYMVFGFFFVIALVIIFVRAGQGGGESGGKQTAEISKGVADGLSSVAKSLQG
jgi:hypothetical protein